MLINPQRNIQRSPNYPRVILMIFCTGNSLPRNTIKILKLIHVTIDKDKKERGPCYMCSNGYSIQGINYKRNLYFSLNVNVIMCSSMKCNVAFHNPKFKVAQT
ncbi:hypothetical protein DICPUDRAFT_73915 [Dictyostelium purpureum]|uniref:Uncharacterized protein n=1 Tax=Dictyostelium purpureum TaxID=5786 RepID=F0Z684_DICPU|nr:uncharacterized protein DICPUDRAFT_73915 [Dictyostelium purpureum]EGC40554.1 hypothetical protein DICPUDRAFT_73915 [Dictyostelium purpureum]|eukprot:XP_003282890.1 hypothetical protein DICPUDRAFT_73915 [Dictyostelium purpureum]